MASKHATPDIDPPVIWEMRSPPRGWSRNSSQKYFRHIGEIHKPTNPIHLGITPVTRRKDFFWLCWIKNNGITLPLHGERSRSIPLARRVLELPPVTRGKGTATDKDSCGYGITPVTRGKVWDDADGGVSLGITPPPLHGERPLVLLWPRSSRELPLPVTRGKVISSPLSRVPRGITPPRYTGKGVTVPQDKHLTRNYPRYTGTGTHAPSP